MRILGLDPGSRYTGYGIIDLKDNGMVHVASGRINATKAETFADRLTVIYNGLEEVLGEYNCVCASIESVFAHKNAMSAIKLGQARGVALLAASHASLEIHEYAPATIKQVVAGHGRASKDDVKFMVTRLLGIRGEISEDASDALAIAICHAHHRNFDSRLTDGGLL